MMSAPLGARSIPRSLAVPVTKAGVAVDLISFPKRREDGKSRGFAFIDVRDTRSALEALDAQGLTLGNRTLVINESHRAQTSTTSRRVAGAQALLTERVYVGNLAYTSTEATIHAIFEAHGLKPMEVYVGKDRQTGRSKGFAFVTLGSRNEAERAIGALNGTIVEGREIAVRAAAPRFSEPSSGT